MFRIFLEHKILCVVFIMFLLLSIICQIIIGVIYRRMIKETDNMSATDNKYLKQCKQKFIHCYQLNEGVANISVFVDKFLAKVSIMGISLTGLQHLAGQFMLLAIAVAGIGACREIIQGETVGKVLPYYIAGFLGLYVYFSVSGLMDIQGKRERLKTHLVDYLENHMVNKLRQSAIDWEELTGEKIEAQREQMQENSRKRQSAGERDATDADKIRAMREELGLAPERMKGKEEIAKTAVDLSKEGNPENGFSKREEQELEELLREFFV